MYTTKKTLLRKIQEGDACSWEEFDAQYRPFICTIGRLCHLDPAACEDVAQNVMLSIFQNKELGWRPGQGRFRDYLAGIVRHHVVNYLRKNPGPPAAEEEEDGGEKVTEDSFDTIFQEEYRQHLKQIALAELRTRVAALTYESFQLTELCGMSIADAAVTLQISKNAVYIHRSRCLRILREIGREIRQMEPDGDI